jgi:dienelactone hydrolase
MISTSSGILSKDNATVVIYFQEIFQIEKNIIKIAKQNGL